MEEVDTDMLWEALRQASFERIKAEEKLKRARNALVSRLCSCYRDGEEWEDRAIWCVSRILNQCPYYLEFRKHTS